METAAAIPLSAEPAAAKGNAARGWVDVAETGREVGHCFFFAAAGGFHRMVILGLIVLYLEDERHLAAIATLISIGVIRACWNRWRLYRWSGGRCRWGARRGADSIKNGRPGFGAGDLSEPVLAIAEGVDENGRVPDFLDRLAHDIGIIAGEETGDLVGEFDVGSLGEGAGRHVATTESV
jgi:hypothetical protein